MKSSTAAALGGAALGLGSLAVLAGKRRKARAGERVRHLRPEQMRFDEVLPGVEKSILWGHPTRGAYAALTRLAPGLKNPRHTHPNDITILVISGAYLYEGGAGTLRVQPGDVLFLPGGDEHESGGDPVAGCLFLETSSGRFDLEPVDG